MGKFDLFRASESGREFMLALDTKIEESRNSALHAILNPEGDKVTPVKRAQAWSTLREIREVLRK